MKLRKILCFILCAILSFSLVACTKSPAGGGGDGDGGDDIDPTIEHVVKFDIGEDALAEGLKAIKPQGVYHNATVKDIPNPGTRKEHSFGGWFDGSVQLTSSLKITKDTTFTAKWVSKAEQDAAAAAYEENLKSWSENGHLYIHYKRYGHVESEEGTVTNTGKPDYKNRISSAEYNKWGAWIWEKKQNIGRTFNAAKIDMSGAVYDIDLNHTGYVGGWDEKTKTELTTPVTYVGGKIICFQLFDHSTRDGNTFWANDGDNNDLELSQIVRTEGGKTYYHWFVQQGRVPYGSAKYSNQKIEDPYKDVETGAAATRTSGKGMIANTTNPNPTNYPQIKSRVEGWEDDAVGYQIFLASFADGKQDDDGTPLGKGMGDLRGVINKLDYLDALNVDVLWLTPFQSSTNYHGYDIKDYFSVDKRFGTEADLRELTSKAHAKGIKIVMDFVLNHTSLNNPWFIKSRNLAVENKGEDNEIDYRQFYTWINQEQYNAIKNSSEAGRILCEGKDPANGDAEGQQWFGPFDGNGKKDADGKDIDGYYFYSSFSSSQPELNYDYQPVRDAILDVCNYWMEYGLDGFRLDAVKHIYMKNEVEGPGKQISSDIAEDSYYSVDVNRNLNFYREFNYRLKQAYPNAYVVGENLEGNPAQLAKYYTGIDSQFNFNFYYDMSRKIAQSGGGRTNAWDTGSGTSDPSYIGGLVDGNLDPENGSVYGKAHGQFVKSNPGYIDGQFTSNHDLPRARDRMNISKTVSSNGSIDDQYAAFYTDGTMDGSKSGTLDLAKVAETEVLLHLYYATLLTLPGITWIYQGDELGMAGLMNFTLREHSTSTTKSEGHEDRVYRQPMKWNKGKDNNASFLIGYKDAKIELVGLNATDSLLSVAESTQSDGVTGKTGTLLAWVQQLTAYRRANHLGNKAISNGSQGGTGKVSYKIGNKEILIYAGQSTKLPNAAYDGIIKDKTNGQDLHYGVVLG